MSKTTYNIECKEHFHYYHIDLYALRLHEAFCRAMKLNYTITASDGSVLMCEYLKKR